MSNELQLAKEMFLKYNGSHFFMSREGDYEKYKSFNVSKEQELIWVNESQQAILAEISSGLINGENLVNRISAILTSIRSYKNTDVVPKMLDLLRTPPINIDSFSKMLIAEDILETVRSIKYNKALQVNSNVTEMQIFALNSLKDMVNNTILVDSSYMNKDYLRDEIKENNIIERVQRSIKEWDK